MKKDLELEKLTDFIIDLYVNHRLSVKSISDQLNSTLDRIRGLLLRNNVHLDSSNRKRPIVSNETKLAISNTLKDRHVKNEIAAPWNKGGILPQEIKDQISLTLRKKYATGEIVSSKGMLGKKLSDEAKTLISNFHKGRVSPMKGRKHTDETRKLMRGKFGDKSYNWRGGTTRLEKIIRNSSYYAEWRQSVFIRDCFKCQHCNSTKCTLNAHHLVPYATIIADNNIKSLEESLKCDLLWDINNGITLCTNCHRKIHFK